MYNRYVSQSDGSFHRDRMPDRGPAPQRPQQPPSPSPAPCPAPQERGMGSFLKQLLPKNFDTGDLLIVLLVLLLAGDQEQDQNHALLTLAIYLFL